MTPDLWVPGLIVLTVGSAVGWWLSRRHRGAGTGSKKPEPKDLRADASLEATDLRQRRDELYARLRDPELTEEARSELELEAARVLKRLDELAVSGEASEVAEERPRPAAVPDSRARTLATGFFFGGATVALIALLVFWAGGDATERDAMTGPRVGQPIEDRPHPEAVLPPEVAAEIEELEARVASSPQDLRFRKRLALLYLANDQYVPAFEHAGAVLALAPEDIDALYVEGVVRMTMGQDDRALARFDRVLELFPEHVRAMTVKGLIFARGGDRDRAAAIWDRALEVGGPQPQIQNLLAMLDAEGNGELPPRHSPTEAGAPDSYTVQIEAETIPGFPQTGVVFVALRLAGGGPPVAVRRIDQPAFPMLVTVGPGDMMIAAAAELPESGILMVRLDQDGSASTRGENDLEGSVEMNRGEQVTIRLE